MSEEVNPLRVNWASILELEELVKIFDAQRTRIIARVIAERPKE